MVSPLLTIDNHSFYNWTSVPCISCYIRVGSFFIHSFFLSFFLFFFINISAYLRWPKTSGQSYKATTILIYVSRVINISNLLVSTTLES